MLATELTAWMQMLALTGIDAFSRVIQSVA
jgi:hypothetical protein